MTSYHDLDFLQDANQSIYNSFVDIKGLSNRVRTLDKKKKTIIFSAVEALFQTEGMLHAFLNSSSPKLEFERDLMLWGAIQALVVQQDALLYIGRALQYAPSNPETLFQQYPDTRKIRDLRDRGIGHPVISDKHSSQRDTLSQKDLLSLPTSHNDYEFSFLILDVKPSPSTLEKHEFDLRDLIIRQKENFLRIANDWKQHLKKGSHSHG